MNITFVKFFQPVAVDRSSLTGGSDVMTHVTDKGYDISLDGILLTISPKGAAANKTIATLHNVAYLKVSNDASATEGSKGARKEKAKPE